MGEGFSNDYLITIGADFAVKRFEENNNVMQIWDLAGQPRFNGVREAYYLGTSGAILVYDITRPDTFNSIPNWIAEVIANCKTNKLPPFALVANKSDLLNEETYPIVDSQQGTKYAKELSDWAKMEIPFIETSAKTGFNVDMMFGTLVVNMETQINSE